MEQTQTHRSLWPSCTDQKQDACSPDRPWRRHKEGLPCLPTSVQSWPPSLCQSGCRQSSHGSGTWRGHGWLCFTSPWGWRLLCQRRTAAAGLAWNESSCPQRHWPGAPPGCLPCLGPPPSAAELSRRGPGQASRQQTHLLRGRQLSRVGGRQSPCPLPTSLRLWGSFSCSSPPPPEPLLLHSVPVSYPLCQKPPPPRKRHGISTSPTPPPQPAILKAHFFGSSLGPTAQSPSPAEAKTQHRRQPSPLPPPASLPPVQLAFLWHLHS